MPDYKVVQSSIGGMKELVLMVNNLVSDGYLPQGGIMIINNGWGLVYHQAMFKP